MATHSATLSSASRSTILCSCGHVCFFINTERRTHVTVDFFMHAQCVPSAEPYCRVHVPSCSSGILRASLSSSRSFSDVAFSAEFYKLPCSFCCFCLNMLLNFSLRSLCGNLRSFLLGKHLSHLQELGRLKRNRLLLRTSKESSKLYVGDPSHHYAH